MNILKFKDVRRRTLIVSALLASSVMAAAKTAPSQARAHPRITTFKEPFGHEIGED